jgi:paraquat-inducible protein B
MSKQASPALVGGFVLGAVVLALGGVILLGSKDFFRETYPFVAYFPSSVNGLRQGAPVKLKGVEIGAVDGIRLLTSQPHDPPVVVFFSLDAEKLRAFEGEELDGEEVQDAIGAGLRARLEQDNFMTGLLFLSLVFVPDSEAKLHGPVEGIPEIPTVPNEFEELAGQFKRFADRLDELDLASLVEDLHATVQSVGEPFRSGQVQKTLVSLDEMLVSVGDAATAVNQELGPLAESLQSAAESLGAAGVDVQGGLAEARKTFQTIEGLAASLERSTQELASSVEVTLQSVRVVFDPTSPPVVRLESALEELGATARAARAVLELLERDPAALVRGKGTPEEQR